MIAWSSALKGSQRREDETAVVCDPNRHQPWRLATRERGGPASRPVGVVISPGGLATTCPSRSTSPRRSSSALKGLQQVGLPVEADDDALRSSALEGSQREGVEGPGGGHRGRHQPWRARNVRRAPRRGQPSRVVISPGGLPTRAAPSYGERPLPSSSAPEGSQQDVAGVVTGLRRLAVISPGGLATPGTARLGRAADRAVISPGGLATWCRWVVGRSRLLVVISLGGLVTRWCAARTKGFRPHQLCRVRNRRCVGWPHYQHGFGRSSSAPEGSQRVRPVHPFLDNAVSSSALEGSQPGPPGLAGQRARGRHQPRRARDLGILAVDAHCLGSSSALEGSQHVDDGRFGLEVEVFISPGGLATRMARRGQDPQGRRHQPWRACNRTVVIRSVMCGTAAGRDPGPRDRLLGSTGARYRYVGYPAAVRCLS